MGKNQFQLCLFRKTTEWEARLQQLQLFDRDGVVGTAQRSLRRAIDASLGGINFFHFFVAWFFILTEEWDTAAAGKQQREQNNGSKAQTASEPQRRGELEQGEASFSAVSDDSCRC